MEFTYWHTPSFNPWRTPESVAPSCTLLAASAAPTTSDESNKAPANVPWEVATLSLEKKGPSPESWTPTIHISLGSVQSCTGYHWWFSIWFQLNNIQNKMISHGITLVHYALYKYILMSLEQFLEGKQPSSFLILKRPAVNKTDRGIRGVQFDGLVVAPLVWQHIESNEKHRKTPSVATKPLWHLAGKWTNESWWTLSHMHRLYAWNSNINLWRFSPFHIQGKFPGTLGITQSSRNIVEIKPPSVITAGEKWSDMKMTTKRNTTHFMVSCTVAVVM